MIKITDLANVLVEKNKLTKQEADFFIPLFIDVLITGLKADKQVKIKGLGTFKVTLVNSRESVDVNTGERIIIEAREKISFTPEPMLRTKVNNPFEQFETIPVSDDVDFSEIDKQYEEHDESDEADVCNKTKDVKQKSNQSVKAENTTCSVDSSLDEVADVEISSTVSVEAQTTEQEQKQEQTKAQTITENTESINKETSYLHEHLQRTKHIQKVLIGVVCFLLLLICVGGIYMSKQLSLRDYRIVYLTKKMSSTIENNIVNGSKKTSNQSNANISFPNAKIKNTQNTEQQKRVSEHPNNKATLDNTITSVSKTSKKSSINSNNCAIGTSEQQKQTSSILNRVSNYDVDPRIRTGAYTIVGIAQTVTVQQGQTLSSISKAHLGPGMECYIEAVNDKKEFKKGDKVNIPSLKLKKKQK